MNNTWTSCPVICVLAFIITAHLMVICVLTIHYDAVAGWPIVYDAVAGWPIVYDAVASWPMSMMQLLAGLCL